MKKWAAIVSSVAMCALSAGRCTASSTVFYFSCLTENDPVSAATAPQFTGILAPYSSSRVQFTINNASGGAQSSITDIYFDDAAHCLSQMTIINGSGVAYSSGAYPTNLPGASNADPDFATSYSADSDYPTTSNGVNPGEYISFRFKGEYDAAVQNMTTDDLRIGIYVQGFAGGRLESFISSTTAPPVANVPAPRSFLLAIVGLGFVRRLCSRQASHPCCPT